MVRRPGAVRLGRLPASERGAAWALTMAMDGWRLVGLWARRAW